MNAITISNLSKKFRIYHDKPTTLKEKLLFLRKNTFEDFWAVKDINLEIKEGMTVGLIGQNGSGKSTLLKLMTQIIYPTTGKIDIVGRVSSLLELGAGFHPDFTGRENIYSNAAIFGLSRAEIDKKIDQIIDFSELGGFIDNPVRTYSSGMYMRLAFSVAINVNPDVLLIDEILAVGDANFQKKCMDMLNEFKRKGVTIVIVAHDLSAIQRLCDHAIWLDHGLIKKQGNPFDVVTEYLDFMGTSHEDKTTEVPEDKNANEAEDAETEKKNENRWGNKDIVLDNICMIDSKGKKRTNFKCGEEATIRFSYARKNKCIGNPVFGVGIVRNDGVYCYGTNTQIDRIVKIDIKDSGIMQYKIKNLNLLQGEYTLDIAVVSIDGFPYDYIRNIHKFSVYSDITDIGTCRLSHEWIIDDKKLV